MANDTYTWVGFFEEDPTVAATSPQTSGQGQLVVALITSKDGTNLKTQVSGGKLPAAVLTQITKLLKIPNVHVATLAATATVARPTATYTVDPTAASGTASFDFPIGARPRPLTISSKSSNSTRRAMSCRSLAFLRRSPKLVCSPCTETSSLPRPLTPPPSRSPASAAWSPRIAHEEQEPFRIRIFTRRGHARARRGRVLSGHDSRFARGGHQHHPRRHGADLGHQYPDGRRVRSGSRAELYPVLSDTPGQRLACHRVACLRHHRACRWRRRDGGHADHTRRRPRRRRRRSTSRKTGRSPRRRSRYTSSTTGLFPPTPARASRRLLCACSSRGHLPRLTRPRRVTSKISSPSIEPK